MVWVGAGLLALLAVTAFAVVSTRDVTCQVIALSFYGMLLALIFFFFQAPDVALSQIAVGTVALPLMVMLAISRMRFRSAASKKAQEHEAKDAA
jgi:energy-converting hydrogenase B subunit D